MKVAFCNDLFRLQENRVLDISWTKNFPGISWIFYFSKLVGKKGVQVVTGDVALSHIQAKYWKPTEVFVMQELNATHGQKLIELGAKAFLLTGLESPLYAHKFYNNLPEIAPKFQHRILFSGIFKTFKSSGGRNYICHFPSYNLQDILPIKNWGQRKFLVTVAANKYFEKPFPIPFPQYLTEYFDWTKDKISKWQSPTRSQAIKNELHVKRLEAIEFFGSRHLLNLFGADWKDLTRLPRKWQKRLKKILPSLNPKTCKDKIKTISAYKFTICFENVSYPGYVTEKIIDCFVAGVIPIYLGAPDIDKFVPANSFIDMRKFNSCEKLHHYLNKITPEEALKIISEGRKFLKTPKGRLYSYVGMAEFVLELVLKTLAKSPG